MDQVIEKRKQFLISALYWTVISIGLILAGKYVLPVLLPFIAAFGISCLLARPSDRLHRDHDHPPYRRTEDRRQSDRNAPAFHAGFHAAGPGYFRDRRLSIQYKSGSKISTLLPSVLFIREVLFLDDLYRHIVSGPEPEGSRPLIQEHIHSVGCPAAGFSGQPEQLCFLRIVDHIKD